MGNISQNTLSHYDKFFEKCFYQLAKTLLQQNFCDSVIMLRFDETKVAKEKSYVQKSQ